MSSLLKRLVQLALLVVAVLLIRHYVFSPAAVNGSSMEPTLHNNDRLWVTSIKKPQRFDIIAFPSPRNGQRVAKRLIGLPGETVEYRDDTLYINGVSLSGEYPRFYARDLRSHPIPDRSRRHVFCLGG